MKLDGTLLEFMKAEARKSIRKRQFGEALGYYKRICSIAPEDPTVWVTLGNIHGWMGNMELAVESFDKALALFPDFADAHCCLGNALCCLNRVPEAVEHYQRAIELKPKHVEARHNLATALDSLGRREEAEAMYRAALQIKPAPSLYYNLANTVQRLGRPKEAEEYYREAVRMNPAHVPAHVNLGNLMFNANRYEAAEACYRRALELRPEHRDAMVNLGSALENQGRLDEALECYDGVLNLRPGQVRATAGKASILEKRGEYEAAAAALQPLLDEGVERACIANVMANVCGHLGNCEETIALLERLIEQDPATIDAREYLIMHFSLGRLLDAEGRYDEAFHYYRKGNLLKGSGHDPVAHEAFVTAMIETFSAEFLAAAPRAGNGSQRPVFIVGMPRSGTSLVEQILASHPDVYGAGELPELGRIAAAMPAALQQQDGPYPACARALTQEDCDRFAAEYLAVLGAKSRDAARVTDKMPNNFLHLGLIALLFPGARVIHCRRDARDTCLSCYFHDFDGAANDFCYDLESLGAYHHQYRRLMDHWAAVLDVPILHLRYEDLIADQEGRTRELLEFCGLPWDDRCLRFNETERYVATASYDQVRRPIYKNSLQRWRHYAPHLEGLVNALALDGRE